VGGCRARCGRERVRGDLECIYGECVMNFVEGLFARECMEGTRITPCENEDDAKKGEDDLTWE